jgi:hypothetical protein
MVKEIEIEPIEVLLMEKTKPVGSQDITDETRCWSPRGCPPPHDELKELEELEVLEIT